MVTPIKENKIKVIRDAFYDDSTIGKLYLNGQYICETLEDKVREIPGKDPTVWKIKSITAIPVGIYKMIMSMSNRFERIMPEILKVPGFTGIRIHSGNIHHDTEGCILLGTTRLGHTITFSRDARKLFESKIKDLDNMTFEIVGLPKET